VNRLTRQEKNAFDHEGPMKEAGSSPVGWSHFCLSVVAVAEICGRVAASESFCFSRFDTPANVT